MPDGILPGIPDAWVIAGIRGVAAFHKRTRRAVWDSPSSDEVAAVIAAVRPLIEAQVREEVASVVDGCGVPGIERRACEEAAAKVRAAKGQERSDEKEPG
jgi:hypothetical protein